MAFERINAVVTLFSIWLSARCSFSWHYWCLFTLTFFNCLLLRKVWSGWFQLCQQEFGSQEAFLLYFVCEPWESNFWIQREITIKIQLLCQHNKIVHSSLNCNVHFNFGYITTKRFHLNKCICLSNAYVSAAVPVSSYITHQGSHLENIVLDLH